MSRQSKTRAIVKKVMQQSSQSSSSQEEKLPQLKQWGMVDEIKAMFEISERETILAFQAANFDFDLTIESIAVQREQERKKQEQRVSKEIKKKNVKEVQVREEQVRYIGESKQNIQLQAKESVRAQSKPIVQLNRRKSSQLVQQIYTTHYNEEYPMIEDVENAVSHTINIVVVGHVDSGKSTIVGMLLKQVEYVNEKQVRRNEKEAKEMGMESFKHAWVMDSTEEERRRGVTIDVGVKKINLHGKTIVFLDSPGHRDFIPNMITGAAQADYAILVIDVNNFQTSFDGGGQTKEHVYIVKSLGVSTLIVAMNKMDRIGWSAQKFLQVKVRLHQHLVRMGFKELLYCPLSAINGVNITKKNKRVLSVNEEVYESCLLQTIDGLSLPIRRLGKPLRMTVTNCYTSVLGKLKGHCMSGKVEGGVVRREQKVVVLPQRVQCVVKEIMLGDVRVGEACCGDHVELQVKLIEDVPFENLRNGSVLSSIKFSVPVAKWFVMEALALDLDMPVLKGTEVVVYVGASKSAARICKINRIYNPNDGTVIKKNPKSIRSHDCAEIQVETKQYICMEIFSNFKTFGRVIIREKKSTLFVGTIKSIK